MPPLNPQEQKILKSLTNTLNNNAFLTSEDAGIITGAIFERMGETGYYTTEQMGHAQTGSFNDRTNEYRTKVIKKMIYHLNSTCQDMTIREEFNPLKILNKYEENNGWTETSESIYEDFIKDPQFKDLKDEHNRLKKMAPTIDMNSPNQSETPTDNTPQPSNALPVLPMGPRNAQPHSNISPATPPSTNINPNTKNKLNTILPPQPQQVPLPRDKNKKVKKTLQPETTTSTTPTTQPVTSPISSNEIPDLPLNPSMRAGETIQESVSAPPIAPSLDLNAPEQRQAQLPNKKNSASESKTGFSIELIAGCLALGGAALILTFLVLNASSLGTVAVAGLVGAAVLLGAVGLFQIKNEKQKLDSHQPSTGHTCA